MTGQGDGARTGKAVGEPGARTIRWIVWAGSLVVFAVFTGVSRVHTRLGVEAFPWDKNGREYVWRVWWRARDNMITVDPPWVFTAAFFALVGLFVVFSVLAFWIALVPDERSAMPDAESAAKGS